ncbi:MAG: hypothetical protein KBT39_00450 [Bacteroidales bacterium]|nr:hypothetical protein [Bacteroidales bacterium]
MKKILLLGAMCLLSMGAYASQTIRLSCGIEVQTVDPSFFPSLEEYADFIAELEEDFCGVKRDQNTDLKP